MTVSSQISRKEYLGDNATVAFDTGSGDPMVFYDDTDLEVTLVTTATGEGVLQVLTTNYTVSGGDGSTGIVTMIVAPLSTETLVIVRVLPIVQQADFVQNDPSDAEVTEAAFDRATLTMQQLQESIGRSIGLSEEESAGTVLTLPFDRASKYLAFDANGDTIAIEGTAATDISAFWFTVLDDETAAESRTSLGLGTGDSPEFTAATLGSAAVKRAGKETMWIPAQAFVPRVTNGCATAVTRELATNDVALNTCAFDQTTSEGAQFMLRMPKAWDEGTFTFDVVWTSASGSGTVTWSLSVVALSNDDPLDSAFGTPQEVTDTLLLADDTHLTAESSAITAAGSPAEGDLVVLELTRNISDTLSADAELIGIRVNFTSNATDNS